MRPVRTLPAFAIAALSAGLLSVAPAAGQQSASALRGHNSDAPVDVAADRIEVLDRTGQVIVTGNPVLIRQAELSLNAPRVTIAYANTSGTAIKRIDASGGVLLRSPSETARSQFAIYDIERRLITMIGGVTLTRRDATVSGGRLVLDLDTGRAVLDGGTGAGTSPPVAAGVATTPSGRVTGRFTVPRRTGSNQ